MFMEAPYIWAETNIYAESPSALRLCRSLILVMCWISCTQYREFKVIAGYSQMDLWQKLQTKCIWTNCV